jgi:hypothetical protein
MHAVLVTMHAREHCQTLDTVLTLPFLWMSCSIKLQQKSQRGQTMKVIGPCMRASCAMHFLQACLGKAAL